MQSTVYHMCICVFKQDLGAPGNALKVLGGEIVPTYHHSVCKQEKDHSGLDGPQDACDKIEAGKSLSECL